MTYKAANGWFADVNGHKVAFHRLPSSLLASATTWANVGPHALTFHYQAGCGSDLYDVEVARGYPIIAFSVDLTGTIHQYCDARIAPWHAYDVSRYAIGVEHAALPGTCELNDAQLTASAALFAALIEWTKDTYKIDIPVKKVGPVTTANLPTIAGIFGHDDITPGSSLNPTGHTDTLYHWTWDQYLAEITKHLQEDDVTTDAEKKTIKDAQDFLDMLTKQMGSKADPTKPASIQGAAARTARTVRAAEGKKP